MADTNDFSNIQENFERITDILDSMRAQNVMNAGDVEKVLTNINNQLGVLSNEENSDLIKVFLAELKRSLEERHNFVSSKFTEIENSFNALAKKAENQLEGSEIKEVFEIIATNLNVFSKDFTSQKELISDIGLKIEELKQDDSSKKDILRNIAVLKMELEKFSNGFESIVLTLNDKFKEISQLTTNLDSSEVLDGIKKDIENIFLSSNAVLSTMQVIDRKNRDLEEIINTFVTKDDFNLEREQVAKLIAQNLQITDYISNLPKQNHVETLSEKVDTAVGVIDALKNMLNETGKQNQQLLSAQLDSLESKILNISTEEEFIGFRKELSEFSKEVIQSTNLMRADLSDTNEGLKSLLSFLSSIDIKNKFDNFSNLTKISENNVKESILDLSKEVSKDIEKNKNLTKTDIKEGTAEVSEKIELAKAEITEASKTNATGILEHIQSVINNLFSVKNALHIENQENLEEIDSKFEELKEELTTSNNYIVQNSHENLENIVSNVEKVFQEILSVKENLGETTEQNSKSIGGGFSLISQKIGEIKGELNQNSQENFANILSIVEDFSGEISTLKASLEQSSQETSTELREFLDGLSEKMASLQNALSSKAETNANDIKSLIRDLSLSLETAETRLNQSSSTGFSSLQSNLQELFEELRSAQENFEIKSQTNLGKIVSLFDDLTREFNVHKSFLSESTQVNFETLSLYIQNLNQKIEETKTNFSDTIGSNFSDLQSSISALPEVIKENQVVFENEKKSLIEENSRNITEMSENIQNLIKGLVAKDSPFKGEVLYEFSELKTNLSAIKEELNGSNQILQDNVIEQLNENIEAIEASISELGERYDIALLSLQNKLVEHFELIQDTSNENNLKLDNSLSETSGIKREIQSVMETISQLQNNSALSELSREIKDCFDGILTDISTMEDNLKTKSSDSLKNILETLQEKFEEVSQTLMEGKTLSTSEKREVISELEDKTEGIKEQITLTGSGILESIDARKLEIMESLSAICESVDKISEINMEEFANGIKNKIEIVYLSTTSAIKEGIKQENEEQTERLSRDLDNLNEKINSILAKVSSDNADEIEELKSLLEIVSERIGNVSATIDNKLNDEFLSEQFAEFEASVLSVKTQNKETLNDALKTVLERLEELNLSEKIEDLLSNTKEEISEKINVAEDVLIQANEDSKAAILDEISQSREEIKTVLIEEISQAQEETKSSLTEEFSKTEDEIKAAFSSEIQESVAEIKEILNSLSSEKSLDEEISQKIEELLSSFKSTSQELEDKLTKMEEARTSSTHSLLSEVKTSFYEKVDDSLDELRSFIEILENKNDLSASFDNLKTEVFEKLGDYSENLESSIASISVKKDLQDLNKDIEVSLGNLFDRIKEDFISAINESPTVNEINEKTVEIERRIEEFKKVITEDITEKLDGFELSIDNNKKDFSELIEELKASLTDLKESYIDLSLNSTMEMSEMLVNSQEKLEEIGNKLGNLDFNEDFNTLEMKINELNFDEKFEAIETKIDAFNLDIIEDSKNELSETLNKEFEAINQKLDIINLDSGSDMEENINEIKQIVESQSGLLEKLEKLDELDSIKSQIEDSFHSFEKNLDKLQENSDEETPSIDIKEDLNSFKTELFENLVDIFNQISFVEESEDIKDFVEEKANEIKAAISSKITYSSDSGETSTSGIDLGESLKSSLDDNFNDILSSLDILHERTNAVDYNLKEVKSQIESTAGESDLSNYSYTLQDIESDIAKVRLILKELSESKKDVDLDNVNCLDLDKLNEDITSISTRTNKLLLNSDESYNALRENLGDFRNTIYQFEENVKHLDNSEVINRIEEKVENANNLVLSCVKSDKIFNQTFMYLAEWVDTASENLGSIIEKTSELDEVKRSISDLKKAMPKTANIEIALDKISKNFDAQQDKINSLEEKIEKLSKTKAVGVDIDAIVEGILAKIKIPEAKADTKLTKKVDSIDKQLTKLGKSIEKITSYVD